MNAPKNEPRKHHYVPRGYLKNFAFKDKNEWKVMVLDKQKDIHFISNIKNVAAENDFYRSDYNNEDFFWEHYYADNIEARIPVVLNNLISSCKLSLDKTCVIDKEMKAELAKIICVQFLRTKKARAMQYHLGQRTSVEVLKSVIDNYGKILSLEQLEYLDKFDYDEKMHKSICLPIINDEEKIDRYSKILMERAWVVYKNIRFRECPFFTSDHPVVSYNLIKDSTAIENNGFALNETVFFFPISGELALMLYPLHMWEDYPLLINNKMIVFDDKPFVMKWNRIQYEQCYRQVYFSLRVNKTDVQRETMTE